jgi:NDP-sugar pyrophosphorylase family protein
VPGASLCWPVVDASAWSLVVMAAGIGSRFGGTKQLAAVGSAGEALLDYTISDARQAGAGAVVLIVRQAIAEDVADHLRRFHADADRFVLVCQDADPEAPPRERPWGTGHAILTARNHVAGSFAVVNADDYYSPAGFETLAGAFRRDPAGAELHLVAYRLAATLSPRGPVSRGVCDVSDADRLRSITEHLAIERDADGRIRSATSAEGAAGTERQVLADDTPVSMNLWGLHADVFEHLARGFTDFVAGHRHDPKAEFLLPEVIGELNRAGRPVRVHRSDAEWLGVTYPGDLDDARRRLAELVAAGRYPPTLRPL